MVVVEKARELWYAWIPGWLPVCMCILGACWWVSSTVTGMNRDILSLQGRIELLQKRLDSIEDYLRTSHDKTGYFGPQSGLQYPHESPQDAGIPHQP